MRATLQATQFFPMHPSHSNLTQAIRLLLTLKETGASGLLQTGPMMELICSQGQGAPVNVLQLLQTKVKPLVGASKSAAPPGV